MDGGTSNTLSLIDPIRLAITVQAEIITKKFGEPNPPFTFTVTGLPNGISLEDAGLDNLDILFTTAADENSAPGLYRVDVVFDNIPQELSEKYNFQPENGTLIIENCR